MNTDYFFSLDSGYSARIIVRFYRQTDQLGEPNQSSPVVILFSSEDDDIDVIRFSSEDKEYDFSQDHNSLLLKEDRCGSFSVNSSVNNKNYQLHIQFNDPNFASLSGPYETIMAGDIGNDRELQYIQFVEVDSSNRECLIHIIVVIELNGGGEGFTNDYLHKISL